MITPFGRLIRGLNPESRHNVFSVPLCLSALALALEKGFINPKLVVLFGLIQYMHLIFLLLYKVRNICL